MQRKTMIPRADWIQKVESVGFTYHSLGQSPQQTDGVYWDESIAYEFTAAEVDLIEAASENLHARCLEMVDHVVRHPEEMQKFGLTEDWARFVAQSWINRDPYIMGRFDLAYDPVSGSVKMLEYNADTPTLAIETSLVQWFWLQDRLPEMDQFNSFHEKLLKRFVQIKTGIPSEYLLHFTSLETYPEEYQHVHYYMDLAQQAGIDVKYVPIDQVRWHERGFFVDQDSVPIHFLHKLYPWEWMASEKFGSHLLLNQTGIIEPAWKMLLSNKAILPLLWKMFPDHPNLLPASWDASDMTGAYVSKPILAREGANISIVEPDQPVVTTPGSYAGTPMVYQALATLPQFAGQNVVIGSWMIGDRAAGMIVREAESRIVVNTSRVVPHYFVK